MMEERILEQADLLCPTRSFRVKEIREPWITNEAVEAIRDKDKLLLKAKKSKKEADWAAARTARNKGGRDLENLRADFLKNQQEINKNDPKKFWNAILSVYPGKKGKTSRIWLKNQNDDSEIDQADTANFINSFFTNIGKDLAKQYNTEWKYFGEVCQNSLEDLVTDADEVKSLCKDINPIKSSGRRSINNVHK